MEYGIQCGDSEHPHGDIAMKRLPSETGRADKNRSNIKIKSGTMNPPTEAAEINRLRSLYPKINWTGVVEHELRKRRRDEE